jgi:hypothetical protein
MYLLIIMITHICRKNCLCMQTLRYHVDYASVSYVIHAKSPRMVTKVRVAFKGRKYYSIYYLCMVASTCFGIVLPSSGIVP